MCKHTKSFKFIHTYMCSQLTTWDWTNYVRVHLYRRMSLPLPLLTGSSSRGGSMTNFSCHIGM